MPTSNEVFTSAAPKGQIRSGIESHSATISTDGSGDGSADVTFDLEHDITSPYSFAVVADADGQVYVEEIGAGNRRDQVRVHISGSSTVSGSVKVFVTRFAQRTFT